MVFLGLWQAPVVTRRQFYLPFGIGSGHIRALGYFCLDRCVVGLSDRLAGERSKLRGELTLSQLEQRTGKICILIIANPWFQAGYQFLKVGKLCCWP